MRCSKCGSDNREGRKFCADCGAPFVVTNCPKCGATNQPDERFCGECGAALGDAPPPRAEESIAVAGSATGERRHLTVLFCDLVGSTEIAAQLDPEEWRELVARYHRAVAEAITRYGGQVAKYLGDGVMAFFGYPEAHDNDAERAARAGLAMVDAISRLNQQSTPPSRPTLKLAVRVGIDSGVVVVGTGAGQDTEIFGEVPNVAARVQAAAAPNAVLMTAATHRLLSGLFVVTAHGARQLKGIATPVELYQVVRPTGVRSRMATRILTPLVGREEELRLLLSRWARVREGEGQMVLVIGEAGIGKSRLLAEFHDHIRDIPHIWMESAGEPFSVNTPFHAVREMLSQWLALQEGANPDELVQRVERALASAGLNLDEAVPLIADLLQIPTGERYPQLDLAPNEKRPRLLATLAGWTLGVASTQPVVRIVEDLHWLDASTLELQQLLAEHGAMVPLMLLYTTRPEFRAPWAMRAHHTQITLNRLNVHDVRAMIAQVTARNALASEAVDVLVERTSGVPLFVEELTRAMLETGGARYGSRDIPVTLYDSLMARLDRLGPAKEILQIGAVIGNDFSYQLLRAVHPVSEQALQRALTTLGDAELVYLRGIAPDTIYQFKHALIRDVAYEALLKSRRKELHRLVATTITAKFPALKESHPELLARHWTEAGEIEPAIAEWSRAGETAVARNAHKEAEESYKQALALLPLLPESSQRDERGLEFWLRLHQCFQITRGYAAPETVEASERAAALAEKSGNLTQLTATAIQQAITTVLAGDLAAGTPLTMRAQQLAVREGSRISVAGVQPVLLIRHYWLGELTAVEKDFATACELYDDPAVRLWRSQRRNIIAIFAYAAWNAWGLGRVDLARKRAGEMMARIDPASPYDVSWSHYYTAHLHLFLRDHDQCATLAQRALELSREHRFPYIDAAALCLLGNARAYVDDRREGIDLIREGIAKLVEQGARLLLGNFTTYLAAALQQQGLISDSLVAIEQALEVNPEILVYRPEMFRLRGELRLELQDEEPAEADFRQAIALARTICAKALELRATTSLARLLERQGHRGAAHAMLGEIYNWFTEGFDTADLKDAKALLDELAG
jgi:class 3 adenylate cyclase/tetratricopeptide (TPR) repeat protein